MFRIGDSVRWVGFGNGVHSVREGTVEAIGPMLMPPYWYAAQVARERGLPIRRVVRTIRKDSGWDGHRYLCLSDGRFYYPPERKLELVTPRVAASQYAVDSDGTVAWKRGKTVIYRQMPLFG